MILHKPDSVDAKGIAVIYLGYPSLDTSICLPAGALLERAALGHLPIGHFSMQGLPG